MKMTRHEVLNCNQKISVLQYIQCYNFLNIPSFFAENKIHPNITLIPYLNTIFESCIHAILFTTLKVLTNLLPMKRYFADKIYYK